jgi:dsDNA-specific endonuclease/ATPase MutS2
VKDLIPEYISACLEKGIRQIRIIHGKGTGTLRTMVHSLLKKDDRVESFHLDSGSSSWGATLVNLRGSQEEK